MSSSTGWSEDSSVVRSHPHLSDQRGKLITEQLGAGVKKPHPMVHLPGYDAFRDMAATHCPSAQEPCFCLWLPDLT